MFHSQILNIVKKKCSKLNLSVHVAKKHAYPPPENLNDRNEYPTERFDASKPFPTATPFGSRPTEGLR